MTVLTHTDVDAMSPLDALLIIQSFPEVASTVTQREQAERAARDHIATHFPATLNHVLAPSVWRGQPADDEGLEPSASAEFGSGAWLHFTQRRDAAGVLHSELVLITPCACGLYQQHRLVGEDDLGPLLEAIAVDADLPCTPGACVRHALCASA